jgi:TolA-binding protein
MKRFVVILILIVVGFVAMVYFRGIEPRANAAKGKPASSIVATKAKPRRVSVPVTTASETRLRRYRPTLPEQTKTGAPAPQYDEATTQAYQNHPKTKRAERTLDAIKLGNRGIRDLMRRHLQEDALRWEHLQSLANNDSSPEAERKSAKAEADALAISIEESEAAIDQFGLDLAEWLNTMVKETRSVILAEIAHPPPPAVAMPNYDSSYQSAFTMLRDGDYAGAEAAFARLAGAATDQNAALAGWQVQLCRVIAGTDVEAAQISLHRGGVSAACYSLAIQAIQEGGWDEAGVWLQQARDFGEPAENAPYDTTLEALGWIDETTKLLLPPGSN